MKRTSISLGQVAIAVVLGLGATAPALASDARPIAATEYDMAQWAPYEQASDGGLTRSEVRDSLRMGRLLGLVGPGGEGSESTDLLAARETFNALQAEVYSAQAPQRSSGSLIVD